MPKRKEHKKKASKVKIEIIKYLEKNQDLCYMMAQIQEGEKKFNILIFKFKQIQNNMEEHRLDLLEDLFDL